MNVLAVDTALSACSVAILAGDRAFALSEPMPRGHAEALMPMIAAALAAAGFGYADIDRFAATVGPGTFTGVRVGVAAVRGFALATGRPAVGVTTLEALAETARARPGHADAPLLVVMDARRDEVYAQAFAADGSALTGPMVVATAALPDHVPAGVDVAFGSGAAIAAAAFAARGRALAVLGGESFPDPLAVARIARDRAAGGPPKPLYLRAPDARPQDAARLLRR